MDKIRDRIGELSFKYPRRTGVVWILASLVFTRIFIINPIQQVEAGAADIKLSGYGGVMSIIFLEIGFAYLIGGNRFARFSQRLSEERQSGYRSTGLYIALLIFGIGGFGVYALLQAYFESKGYK